MNLPPNVFVFDTSEQLALAAAERFAQYANLSAPDRFRVALAGGNTPRRVYELLATDPFAKRVDWSQVDLFFGDERCVPPDHPESNYRMAYEALIAKVAIPAGNVYRIIGEGNPGENANQYESQLRKLFGESPWPRFNLILLGMGEDGHTASLFPGGDALKEESKWVVATRHPESGHERVTLTVPVLNHAARVIFLVTGAGKAERFAQVLRGERCPDPLPVQLIHPVDGSLEWLVDRAAAAYL